MKTVSSFKFQVSRSIKSSLKPAPKIDTYGLYIETWNLKLETYLRRAAQV